MGVISVRPASLDDLETIVDFSACLAHESEQIELGRATVSAGVRAVLDDPSKGRYFIAQVSVDGGTREGAGQLLITYEWSDWRNGMFIWIQSVYVEVAHRRKGVFTALYSHVADLARSPGYCGVRLYVHDHNASARQTYTSLGMADAGYRVLETPDELKP
mgnify:FL=1